MRVFRDTEKLPGFRNSVVTIGTFDGVHLGHQKIIAQMKEEAARIDGETVIITFFRIRGKWLKKVLLRF